MKRFLQILIISMVNVVLVGCSSDLKGNQMSVNSALTQNSAANQTSTPGLPSGVAVQTLKKPTAPKKETVVSPKKEEKVIISINNFGRTNPFKPFEEKLITGDSAILPMLKDIPPPPAYTPNPNVTNLMQTKISGILYDSVRPSAIINVNGKDYLVHRGDMIFNYYIKDIRSDKVLIKYANNIYTAGIGEVVGGQVDQDPVKGLDKSFGASQKTSSAYNIKIVTPTYMSPFN